MNMGILYILQTVYMYVSQGVMGELGSGKTDDCA